MYGLYLALTCRYSGSQRTRKIAPQQSLLSPVGAVPCRGGSGHSFRGSCLAEVCQLQKLNRVGAERREPKPKAAPRPSTNWLDGQHGVQWATSVPGL